MIGHLSFAFRSRPWPKHDPRMPNHPDSSLRYRLLSRFYDIIRPLFVEEWDHNEDYLCGYCCKPVLRRYLYCSVQCSEEQDR